MSETEKKAPNFITEIIDEDIRTNRFGGKVVTRFPPEPNGYLHIGHAKAICLDYGLAEDYGGVYNLRFDDTNPTKEDVEYVDAIKEDIRWLGFDWGDREYYASDYFDQLYEYAVQLIRIGKAYVDDLSADEIREYRGSLTEPGKESPHRNRSIEENLDLFERMRAGEFDEGSKVLRAKIDMASPNINMRDPVMYRILKTPHHRTGDKWVIYPTYDWAHGQSDSIEGITHSMCSLEFEDHRPLYDWFMDNLEIHHSRQIEFAKLYLTNTIMSKRNLIRIVEEGLVDGWDDPRMPTLSGFRRRGVRPEAIRKFCDRIGAAKTNSVIEMALLEHTIREDLDPITKRVMAVLDPIKVVIENFPEDEGIEFDVDYYRHDPEKTETRKVTLTKEIYIERGDFMIEPPPKYFRLSPGREVRLMNACLITCTGHELDDAGNVSLVKCSMDLDSIGGQAPDGRRVKGTMHWVSASLSVDAEIREYDYLISDEEQDDDVDFMERISRDSKHVRAAKIEQALAAASPGERFQFLRHGYFYVDPIDTTPDRLVFNKTISLRDSWKKMKKKK
jgi:glutaminyl-tRNA synthetase